jgi:glycosyltransferase involved in cell wall biosynthesis
MRFTDAMITLTQREKRDYLDRRIGSDAVVHPIHSGLELAPYLSAGARREAVRRELGLNDDDFVVGTVARLVPIKNHSLIVQSASRLAPVLPCLRFVFVGDGSLREELEERVRRLGLHHLFRFTGWRTDTADLLSAFDVFAMVSRNEGMGRAFVEAQAAGLPVIGSRVGGVPEVVRENVTGYLVEPDNPAELAECIQMLYTRRASPARTAECCREWVNPRFSAQSMVESIDRLYRSLLESPREQ